MKCSVTNCYSRAKNASKVQVFPFPTDKAMARKWARQSGIEPGNNRRICQLHFNDGCFVTSLDEQGLPKNTLNVKKTAIPTIFNFGPPKTSRRLNSELNSSNIDLDLKQEEPASPSKKRKKNEDENDESDDDYDPEEEENSSPTKKKETKSKPTRFSMMLDDGQVKIDNPEPKSQLKEEVS